jgi:hypothetical protein
MSNDPLPASRKKFQSPFGEISQTCVLFAYEHAIYI